jgi:hypothetical protein
MSPTSMNRTDFWGERSHRNKRPITIQALVLGEVREPFVVTAPHEERLGFGTLRLDHFMGLKKDMKILNPLKIWWGF